MNKIGPYDESEIKLAMFQIGVKMNDVVTRHPESWEKMTIVEQAAIVSEETGELVKAANNWAESGYKDAGLIETFQEATDVAVAVLRFIIEANRRTDECAETQKQGGKPCTDKEGAKNGTDGPDRPRCKQCVDCGRGCKHP